MEKRIVQFLESTLAFLLAMIATLVVTLVFLRYLFNTSIAGANEWVAILFAYLGSFGTALGVANSDHLAIRYVVDKLPQPYQAKLDRVIYSIVAAMTVLGIYGSLLWITKTGSYLMPTTGLPRWVAQISIPFGCLATLYFSLRKVVGRSVCSEKTSDRVSEEPDSSVTS